MTLGRVLTAFLVLISASLTADASGLRQIVTRNVSGVRLDDGQIMEIVEEQSCSASLVRLTCRSLTSFVFVLEAKYQANRTDSCVYDRETWCRYKSLFKTIKLLQMRRNYLRSNYPDDVHEDPLDFRSSLNRRCSGLHHCRYKVMSDHPEALFWRPANIRIKYACIPEASVFKYCNADLKVPSGEGGYLKSPGYPLYYLGGMTCGWTFTAYPGQRIVITFHDLSIREHERDGSCIDIVRVRDSGNTLFESCGDFAGVKIVSNTNIVTLNLISSTNLYPARGFFLQYQILGCPDVTAPSGSYVVNGSLDARTFLCRAGTLFPDSGQRARTIHCRNGQWDQSVSLLPACIASSAAIARNGADGANARLLAGLSEDIAGSESDGTAGILDQTTRIDRGPDDAVAKIANVSMDQKQPAMIKDADYVVDVILPTALIALLFLCNAVIVYVISVYRKRNVDNNSRKAPVEFRGEDIALSAPTSNEPQV